MNIIFLDIDGVLNNDSIFRLSKQSIDESCVEFFIDALEEVNNAKVVISSIWRIGNKNLFEFENMICQQHAEPLLKILSFLHDDWRTKKLNKIRGNEIEEWLSRHQNIDKFICIDDDNDFLKTQPLLRTDLTTGFGIQESEILKMFFNGSNDNNIKWIKSRIKSQKKVLNAREKFINEHLK